MSVSTTKIIRAVTLRPGEVFSQPPGSRIVGTTGLLESTCGEVPDIEPLVCYKFLWSTNKDGDTGPFTSADVIYYGISYGGVRYNFGTPLDSQADHEELLAAKLAEFTFLTDINWEHIGDVEEREERRVSFKTIPSIGESLFLVGGAEGFGGEVNPYLWHKAIQHDCE